jgi:hypothetical protein
MLQEADDRDAAPDAANRRAISRAIVRLESIGS